MNIPEQYHDIIVSELKSVKGLCESTETLEDKMYYFSASYGIINRIMNLYSDPTLIFIQQILQIMHKSITERLAAVRNPNVVSASVPDEMIDALFNYYDQLIKEIENNDNNKIREVLEKISILSYATTGNGFYMYLKGKIDLK
ncbi:MAG: hypothetical protein OEZ22_13945 [Spirochaetia bacterium]|nr:hypothetical protein [Spirochaetia bacterium]